MISDIISFCIIGALLKLFKFKSMRNAVFFYILPIIFDFIMKVYMSLNFEFHLISDIIKNFDTPLLVQITFFQLKYN